MSNAAERLEAVVARLEALANSLQGGGGAAPAAAPAAAAAGPTKKLVSDFQNILDNEVAAFVVAATAIKDVAAMEIPDMANVAYGCLGDIMAMAADCKKPENKALMAKVDPIIKVLPRAEKAAFKRGKFNNHATAFKEMLAICNFIFVPKPRGFCDETCLQPDMYLNKILIAAKKQEGDEQKNNRAFVSTAKAVGAAIRDYVKEHHAAAVSWNAKGGDADSWTKGGAGGAAPAPPAGLAPPPAMLAPPPVIEASASSAPAAPGGMSAVFAQISKGSAQCESAEAGGATAAFQLKRVTKDMKKEMKKLPPKEAKKKAKKAKKKVEKKVAKKVKPPSCEFRQGTWWVENQVETKEVTGVEIKHNVYIYNAGKITITIPGKVKSIAVDNCKRTTIIFDQVISTFELVGCDACKVYCRKSVPSVAIDKSKGTIVNLSAEAAMDPPELVTSNISETNVSLPGADPEKDDPVEIAIPEQYLTKITGTNGNWNCDTEMVTHGG